MIQIKKSLPYLISILFFVIISVVFFMPDIAEGKVLFQADTMQGIGVGQEGVAFREKTGEITRWTNSLFSGMPNYQITPSYAPSSVIRFLENAYRLWLPSPASLVFIMLLGFFILLISLNVKWYLAVIGAIAYAFSSYFFILIEAGHLWKFITLAYIPPTIAGILLVYRGKYLIGAFLAALFATFQISANHVQMTYYSLFVILALITCECIAYIKEKRIAEFFKASGVLIAAALLAVAANWPNLYNTYEYSKESTRGLSELAHPENTAKSGLAGLEKDYITSWSYGLGETWSLLIPDIKGGSSVYIGQDKNLLKDVPQQYKSVIAQQMRYWGDQPFTSGPVYVGAFVLMLFILGCFIVKGPLKWALLSATILSIVLAWGKNFMPLTDLFIDYFPMYNKFRAVSSMLVIAEFCIPILAILALKEIIENPGILKAKKRAVFFTLEITAGVALLFALFPNLFFSYLSQQEQTAFLPQAKANPQIKEIIAYLESVRESIFTADAWRSLIIICLGAGLTYLYATSRLKKYTYIIAIGALILCDLYMVDKRYLNSSNFVPKRQLTNPFPMTEADKEILQDQDPNFRVFNLSVQNPFSDPTTSYYHKSIGGYHAAKLRRYQDLIEHQLSKGNQQVLNMLNTKYFILADENGKAYAQHNAGALGNGWFVSNIKWVDNADEEMETLDNFNPLDMAVIDVRFKDVLGNIPPLSKTQDDTIRLTSYKPNELIYTANSLYGGLAVFSEIYYPDGWKVTIDGKPVKEIRADYVLRALYIPEGTHEIVFRFDPDSVRKSETIAFIALAFIGLLFIYTIIIPQIRRKNKKTTTNK